MNLQQRTSWLISYLLAVGLPAYAQMNPDQMREVIKNLRGAAFTFTEVDARIAQIKQQMDTATASGSLSPAEIEDIQTRLKRIAATESQLKQKKQSLSCTQALTITKDLNRIIVRLRDSGKFKANSIDDVSALRKSLSDQISSAVSGVLLTRADASKLTSELNDVKAAETGLKHSGNVPPAQIQKLANALQRVNAHFAQDLKLIQSALSDLNKREADLELLIDNSVQNESISQKDATNMRRRLDLITATQTSILDTNADSPLASAQVFMLAGQIDLLQQQLEKMGSSTTASNSGLTPFTPREPVAPAPTAESDAHQ